MGLRVLNEVPVEIIRKFCFAKIEPHPWLSEFFMLSEVAQFLDLYTPGPSNFPWCFPTIHRYSLEGRLSESIHVIICFEHLSFMFTGLFRFWEPDTLANNRTKSHLVCARRTADGEKETKNAPQFRNDFSEWDPKSGRSLRDDSLSRHEFGDSEIRTSSNIPTLQNYLIQRLA